LKLRSVLLALVGVAASTAAIAADLPTRKAPPAPVPVVTPWSWTGFYVGGYVGGTFGSANWSDDGYNYGGTNYYWGTGGNSNTQAGFVGGGYVGANYQFNQFVIGVEGEFGYSGINSHGTTWTGNIAGTGPLAGNYALTSKFSDTGVGRLRGRLGYAVEPQLLLYVAGGWTWANTNTSLDGYCCGGNPTVPANVSYFNLSNNKSLDGWNIGVGGEYAFTPNWIARIEYIYDGFSKISYGYNYGSYFGDNRNLGLNINTVRVGLEYKF
jgi:outer membrane immunogenic protein